MRVLVCYRYVPLFSSCLSPYKLRLLLFLPVDPSISSCFNLPAWTTMIVRPTPYTFFALTIIPRHAGAAVADMLCASRRITSSRLFDWTGFLPGSFSLHLSLLAGFKHRRLVSHSQSFRSVASLLLPRIFRGFLVSTFAVFHVCSRFFSEIVCFSSLAHAKVNLATRKGLGGLKE